MSLLYSLVKNAVPCILSRIYLIDASLLRQAVDKTVGDHYIKVRGHLLIGNVSSHFVRLVWVPAWLYLDS